jgi:hypothetical protein
MTTSVFNNLEPRPVWEHFATLCAIPRASKREAALRDHLLAWARARGLETRVDAAGNLILRKPASPGRENRPGVILQGHLDMVCQKNASTVHDFRHDPIRPMLQDGWLVTPDTTLGADNGIGVALALAALEVPDLAHPPLEVLLTVDEEAGMGGAPAPWRRAHCRGNTSSTWIPRNGASSTWAAPAAWTWKPPGPARGNPRPPITWSGDWPFPDCGAAIPASTSICTGAMPSGCWWNP